MNNIQISKNFKLKEFQCRSDGCILKIDSNLLYKLQLLPDKLRKLYPTSGEICPINHNSKDVNTEDEDIEDASFDDGDHTLFDLDYDENPPDTDKVLKTFDFSNI